MKLTLCLGIALLINTAIYSQVKKADAHYIYTATANINKRGLVRGVHFDSILRVAKRHGYIVDFKGVSLVDVISGADNIVGVTNWDAKYSIKDNWYFESTIVIEKKYRDDHNIFEAILAHEYGHVLGLIHQCGEIDCENIMSPIITVYTKDSLMYELVYNSHHTELYWDLYFKKIKAKYYIK